MSYRIENENIIISGFEKGIADSPYAGISDMRNVNITSIPDEASVALATAQTNSATASGSVASADAATDIVTYSGITGTLFNGRAVTFAGGSLPAGIVAGTVYFMGVVSGSTSKLYTKPDLASGNLLNITGDGTGTFASVDMGKPSYIVTEQLSYIQTNTAGSYNYYLVDTNNRIWYWNTLVSANSLTQNIWIFTNSSTSGKGQGLVAWNSYLIDFRSSQIDYIQTYSGTSFTLLSNAWTTNWQPDGANSLNTTNSSNTYSHEAYVGLDGILYYCDGFYIGSLALVSSSTFDPTNSATYTWSRKALTLPTFETAQCLIELGPNLLIGCASNDIYQWDKVSTSFILGSTIRVPETNIFKMLTVNSQTYIFAGNRGFIYITNGSQAEEFKKVPDHLSGVIQPYFTWGGATFYQKTLYFGVIATTNAGATNSNYGGLWAIDLDTGAMRLLNQLSYGTYAQIASAISPIYNTSPAGYALWIGWGTGAAGSSTGGVDSYSANPLATAATPYTGGQAYIDSDFIPVGTLLDPFTPSQVEWKTSVGIGANGTSETIALYYRTNLSDSFTLIGTTSSTTGQLSDMYQVNFQKAQWIQIRAILTSTATTPTYCRLKEFRIRDYTGPISSSLQTYEI